MKKTKCEIEKIVFDLIRENTLDELQELKAGLKSMLNIMSIATPADPKSGLKQKANFKAMYRCVKMAIAYIKESEVNQA